MTKSMQMQRWVIISILHSHLPGQNFLQRDAGMLKCNLLSHQGSWKSLFFFFFFLGPYLWHMEVPGLEVKSELPKQCHIQAAHETYPAACGSAGSLTHWERPGIQPPSSWMVVRFLTCWDTRGTPEGSWDGRGHSPGSSQTQQPRPFISMRHANQIIFHVQQDTVRNTGGVR